MSGPISDAANKAALDDVRKEKPSSFTVGGYLTRDGRVVGGVTYDRKFSNLWGLTAYARAYLARSAGRDARERHRRGSRVRAQSEILSYTLGGGALCANLADRGGSHRLPHPFHPCTQIPS